MHFPRQEPIKDMHLVRQICTIMDYTSVGLGSTLSTGLPIKTRTLYRP